MKTACIRTDSGVSGIKTGTLREHAFSIVIHIRPEIQSEVAAGEIVATAEGLKVLHAHASLHTADSSYANHLVK